VTLTLLAPLKGWVGSLDEVPDAVFAERMLGDGVAIDPIGSTLHAPCDAEVVSVARTRHAITLRAENGAEILIHIGLETVTLGGEGFTAHVEDGQTVRAGDRLISFDLDHLARRAKSLLTPVLITNPDAFAITWWDQGRQAEVGEPLMTLRALVAASETATETMPSGNERRISLTLGFRTACMPVRPHGSPHWRHPLRRRFLF
jgi:glucose-specific phosphotransferase system IIA component